MKNILITGVSQGMGMAYCKKFLAAGWRVWGTATTGELSYTHPNLEILTLDLTKPDQIAKVAQRLKSESISLDVLINNAGVNLSSATEHVNRTLVLDILRQTLEINIIGPVDLTEKLIEQMNRGSIIVNISSGAGAFHPFIPTGSSSYQISKAALNMYTKTLASRLESQSIAVWSYDPGWVRTAMGGEQAPKLPETAAEELYDLIMAKPPSGTFWTEKNHEREW